MDDGNERFIWTAGRFIGGALCLDLANTVVHPLGPARRERIADAQALADWARAAVAFGPAGREAGMAATMATGDAGMATGARLGRALALRSVIDAAFRSSVGGLPIGSGDAARLLAQAARCVAAMRWVDGMAPGGGQRCVDDVLGWSALSAVRLLATLPNARLRACAACDWLFVDLSRGGRRRWCDMAVCGNRAKASRRRDRREAEAP